MKSFVKRAITGSIYVAVIVLSLLFTGWAFPLVCTLFAVLSLIEFDKLTRNVGTVSGVASGLDMLAATVVLAPAIFGAPPVLGVMGLSLYMIVRMVVQLYLHSQTPVTDIAKSFLSFGWIVIPLLMLEQLFTISSELVLTIFIMIWLNDTGAFCTGSLMGRTKLFERISPKKTWEGFAGGFLVTALFGYFAPQLFELAGSGLFIGPWLSLALGVAVSILATFGDLCESLFKRALHAKDSGKLLPGHGGILDRIDSLLIVSAGVFVAWLYMLFT